VPRRDHDETALQVTLNAETIARELGRHHPDLTLDDRRQVAAALIQQIEAAIRNGDRLGVIKQRRDGTIEINYLAVEPSAEMKKRIDPRRRR
jgi:hypothetical protein